MSHLAQQQLQIADPLHLGHSPEQVGLLMTGANGVMFPWTDGGVALVRRELYPAPGAWQFCGIARSTETSVKNFEGMTHLADQAYQYSLRQFIGNGFVSPLLEPIRVDFDSNGDLITPALPMFPKSVTSSELAGGKFLVEFEYDPFGQGAAPTDFQVFADGVTPGTIDYATPLTDSVTGLAYVTYVAPGLYSFTTAAYADGVQHIFGVRARNSSGVAEKNQLTTVVLRALNAAPSSAPEPTFVRSYV